jgi:hypothetical protein
MANFEAKSTCLGAASSTNIAYQDRWFVGFWAADSKAEWAQLTIDPGCNRLLLFNGRSVELGQLTL